MSLLRVRLSPPLIDAEFCLVLTLKAFVSGSGVHLLEQKAHVVPQRATNWDGPVWVCVCVCARGRISVSMSECARMRVDARLSPAQEAQFVSVEVEL